MLCSEPIATVLSFNCALSIKQILFVGNNCTREQTTRHWLSLNHKLNLVCAYLYFTPSVVLPKADAPTQQ